jgi:hypothetical protein
MAFDGPLEEYGEMIFSKTILLRIQHHGGRFGR